MFLTRNEIAELTSRKLYKAQRAVLNHLGIEHKVRPDVSLVVLRSHVEKSLSGESGGDKLKRRESNWSAI